VNLTIRARLTLLYFIVLAASFAAFFWICDFGFRRSIEITVNDASRTNLERVRAIIEKALPGGIPSVGHELTALADLWASGALFEVAGSDGQWIFQSPRFLKPQAPFPELASGEIAFLTTNLDLLQYRIARQKIALGGYRLQIDAAVPTEPFDQALDNFRLIEKEFLPLLVILASFLGYWLSGRALAPVNQIIESAEGIGVLNLSRRLELPEAKDELRRLTETLNAMLGRIESSVKRITQFTADASHDLRTPLSLIRTNAELALRRKRSPEDYRGTLSRILAISEETSQLIDGLLALARADTGAAQWKCEPLDLRPILLKLAQQARFLAAAKGLSFSERVLSEALPIFADPAAIERLLLSILDNAVKYTPIGGRVTVRASAEEHSVTIEIEDTGIGIAESDLPHVFERFFRADQARSREIRGSGLGLSIARSIAEMHHGAIEVTSRVGRGSCFRVRLPRTAAVLGRTPSFANANPAPLSVSESSVT
jgi:heavy metal sensor kinase